MILSWHVDYWDYLGWKDPFGAKAFTARQRALAKARKLRNIWTPMICVDGTPLRGRGQARKMQDLVARRHAKPAAFEAKLAAKPGVEVTVQLRRLRKEAKLPARTEAIAVLFQEKATTNCTAGENKGKTLHELFVVRAVSKPLDLEALLDKGHNDEVQATQGRQGVEPRCRGAARGPRRCADAGVLVDEGGGAGYFAAAGALNVLFTSTRRTFLPGAVSSVRAG